jgi:hypothetical protein
LCFTTSPKPKYLVTTPFFPYFVCDEGDFGGSVAEVGEGLLFWSWLKPEALAQHSANLRLLKDPNDPHPFSIRLVW